MLKSTIAFILLSALTSFISANIVVINGLTHENTALPGEKYRNSIQIQNAGDEKQSVRIYPRDYWFSHSGESKHDLPGSLPRSNAAWITYTPQLITLEPREKAIIEFEVNIPDNDSLIGTYWSVIMIEGITTPDTTATSRGVKINTAIRYAIQIITNIGNTGSKDLQFIGFELTKEANLNVLNVSIENSGESILKPELNLEVFDDSGNSIGVFKADRRKTFPGTSVKMSLVLEGIKPGTYSATLVADCDEDHVFGTNFSLEI